MSGTFILAPGEEFLQCPYNTSHQITNARMLTHLDKCRKSYLKTLTVDGQRSVMKVCRYNAAHHVPKVELKFHHETCPDKAQILPYLAHLRSDEGKKTYEQRRKEELEKNMKKEKTEPGDDEGEWQEARGRRKDRDRGTHSTSTNEIAAPVCSLSSNQLKEMGLEEEDWEADSMGYQPGYDPKLKLKKEVVMYNPHGLTKSERKKFRNEIRLRAAMRSLTGEQLDLPVPTDFDLRPNLSELWSHDMDKKVFPQPTSSTSAIRTSERLEKRIGAGRDFTKKSPPLKTEIIDSDDDFDVEVVDFQNQSVPPSATATSSSSAAAYNERYRPESDEEDLSHLGAAGGSGSYSKTQTNFIEWPWPSDGSDIWNGRPNYDDFEGTDPYEGIPLRS